MKYLVCVSEEEGRYKSGYYTEFYVDKVQLEQLIGIAKANKYFVVIKIDFTA